MTLPVMAPDPTQREATVQLADTIYQHVEDAGIAGLPVVDIANALALVLGMLLKVTYTDPALRHIAAGSTAIAAVRHAAALDQTEPPPKGALGCNG